jgi:hypothetical protein
MTIYDNDSGLVSLWRLNESSDGTSAVRRADSIAANHLTDNNTVASSLTAKEGSRSASFVRANSEYLSITDAAQTGLDLSTPLSIVLWVKFNALGSIEPLIVKGEGAGDLSYSLQKQADNSIRFTLSSDGTATSNFDSTITISDTDWHHIGITVDAFVVEIYLDGANVSPASNDWTSAIFDTGDDFLVGALVVGGSYTDGLIDEIAVFNRALLQAEVRAILTFSIRPAQTFPARYKIEHRNTSGTLVAEFNDFLSLSFTKKINEVPSASLVLYGEDARVSVFSEDDIIQIYRDITRTSAGWYIEWEGFFVDIDPISTDDKGLSTFVAKMFGYLDLIKRRYIYHHTDSAESKKSGPGETVIKEYVDENAGPGATVPPRETYSGVTTGLTIEADGATGDELYWTGEDKAWQGLLPTIQAISEQTDVLFAVASNTPASFEFRTYDTLLGDDRSTIGLYNETGLNGAGNVPVIFALERGNMVRPSYSKRISTSINTSIVLGQGVGGGQNIGGAQGDTSGSPWAQREFSSRASSQVTATEIATTAEEEIQNRSVIEKLTFEPAQQSDSQYAVDYFLGDKITAKYLTIEAHYIISGITINLQPGQAEQISIELEPA